MQGLATKNLLRALNASAEEQPLAPESEAPPWRMPHDIEPSRVERWWNRAWRIGMWIVMLGSAAIIGLNSRAPNAPYAVDAYLTRACVIDEKENCLVCTFTDSAGRERHKNAHCPALVTGGMLAWPLGAKAQ